MKNFYSVEPKHNFQASHRKQEFVEYDINSLILLEAEVLGDAEENLSDEEFEVWTHKKAKEIKEELIRNGIWRNEFGQPVFLYC